MSSDRRSSLDARSINSRVSVDSSSLRAPQIAPIPTSAPLTEGTSIPAPSPPMPPPKDPRDRLQAPMTPQRKPILRKKSPLSAEAFSSPASSMPGAFPATSESMQTPQFHTTAYASSPSPQSTLDSKSPKRPGSIRNFLSLKRLRRSHDSTPGDPAFRPASPSGESITSSMGPSLKKKMSGSFWKRKSSMGMNYGTGDEGGTAIGHTGGYGGTLNGNGNGNGTVLQVEPEGRSSTPALPGEEPLTPNKRKSATFWRRKSTQSLADALENQIPGRGKRPSAGDDVSRAHRDHDVAMGDMDTEKMLPQAHEAPITRSDSPPPQLPEFVGAGGGLGGEDLFRDIH